MTLDTHRMVRGFRVFSSAADAGRVRRPTDIVLLITGLILTLALTVAAPGPTALDTALSSLITALQGFGGWLWEISYAVLAIWVLVLIVLTAIRRPRILIDYLASAAIAFAVGLLAGLVAGTPVSESLRTLASADPPAEYLGMRVALATAIIVTASPHLARPFRYIGRVIVVMGAIAAVVLGSAQPIGAMAGLGVGLVAAAITHLAFGSPGGRPTAKNVDEALAELGLDVHDVVESDVALSGVALFTACTADDRHLIVKVYGRDAWDGQLITSTWSALQNRGETPRLATNRTARVEHEAFVTLLAERSGVSVLPVLAAGRSSDGDALLVSAVDGHSLASSTVEELDDATLQAIWRELNALHDIGISHGDVHRHSVFLRSDGSPALTGFADATVAASTSMLMTDSAQLLVALAIAAGHERAVAATTAVIGADGLADLLPLLQPAVLDRSTRKAIEAREWSLEDLRATAVAAAGVEPPELLKLRRVTLRSSIMTLLIGVFAYAIISRLAGVDFEAVWDELSSADFTWLIAALLVAPTAQVSYSFATLGASIVPLRYWPVLMLEYAIQFIAVVLPATAARLALEIRFFERFGIEAGAAVSIGVLDSFTGFLVQIVLIIGILLSGLPGFTSSVVSTSSSTSSTSSTTDTSGSSHQVLALAIVLVVGGAILTLVVPKLRNRVRTAIPKWREAVQRHAAAAREVLTVVRHPAKVGQMLVGNLGAQVIQAIVLGLCLKAFGSEAALSQLILINTAVSLFAGLMPVPGGMGVAEAGYTAGLQAIGVPSAVAISTAIAFRLVTFYLPPLWGSVAMRWLRRHSYV